MNFINIEGNNFEIGYETGKWWAEYFQGKKQAETDSIKTFLKGCPYIDYLQDSWRPEYMPLLEKAANSFPDIMQEISGMVEGVLAAGLETSFEHIFALCLGETGDKTHQCSSVVMKTRKGFLLGHNEEDDNVYPLLPARVTLKQGKSSKEFISISYPFQLLCSSIGMSARIAFQGNSIGYYRNSRKLERSWRGRLPKTILTRKMVELDSIEEIVAFYKTFPSTLPCHHYILARDQAYSLDVVPGFSAGMRTGRNIIRMFPVNHFHFSTNHFLSNNYEENKKQLIFQRWKWSDDNNESKERYLYLEKHLSGKHKAISKKAVTEFLLNMAKEEKYILTTSASIILEMSRNKAVCEGRFYFGHGYTKKINLITKS